VTHQDEEVSGEIEKVIPNQYPFVEYEIKIDKETHRFKGEYVSEKPSRGG
jgi:hypothetical protein